MRNHENMQNQHESSCINFLMAHGSINDFKDIFDALTGMNLYVGRLWPLQLLKKFVFRPSQEEHGSKRVSCDEFQKNVDQHVKDELGKLQFPG